MSPAAPDVIELRGLELVGICGALPEERVRAQPLQVDLDVHADLSAAGASDALADTVDYGALCDAVAAVVAAGTPQLLEHLSAVIADAVLAVDPRIDAVTVWLRKLRPPVPHALATSGVRIHRAR
ncbi:dihydroneopterin aldolase [Aquihabitans sp. G128]|uniref:dihydroneopterin aldolase n=1 Tax=Aquihabitans sp. G128 TaxID=2849779 RepID=UPI001C250171|nr:dihydroneopterin aldolase [Aquihabitans sp. G128]QXC59272.1 dihydroneopterin aldolase [Aquihabitans sp. G128]